MLHRANAVPVYQRRLVLIERGGIRGNSSHFDYCQTLLVFDSFYEELSYNWVGDSIPVYHPDWKGRDLPQGKREE